MFLRHESAQYVAALPGIERATLAYGENTLMTAFRLEARSTLPRHAHPHEQTGYLVSGHMRLSIGTEEYEVTSGDSWSVPGGVMHGAEVAEDSLAVEVFSPVRADYLPIE